MKRTNLIYCTLSLIIVLAIMVPLTVGCGSSAEEPSPSPSPSPAPTPTPVQSAIPTNPDDIVPNEAVVFCQVTMFGEWDGAVPRTMTINIIESTDVEGKKNYFKDMLNRQFDVIIDEDVEWLMLGNQINCNIELRAEPDGSVAFHVWNLVH